MKDSTAYMITDVLKDSFKYGFATQATILDYLQLPKRVHRTTQLNKKRAMGS